MIASAVQKHRADDGLVYYTNFDAPLDDDVFLDPASPPVVTTTDGDVVAADPQVITADVTIKGVALKARRAVSFTLSGGTAPRDNALEVTAVDDNGKTWGATQPVEVRA